MTEEKKVVVAMSGGVDSSVAAALLVEAGYTVTGMMLRLWSEPDKESSNRCCTPDSIAEARRVANKLGIPFYVIDAKKSFYEIVVQSFLSGYMQGITPNPCLVCNREIRWGLLLEHAINMGADILATGHYAQVIQSSGGILKLHRGKDTNKDQSYVLSVLNQHQLQKTILPIGGYKKEDVRKIAHRFGLTVADREDSQDLCFLAGQDYRDFLIRYVPSGNTQGNIEDTKGKILGTHRGLANYTIGQRKGLGIASQIPMYVLEKRINENVLIVGEGSELGHVKLSTDQVNWISGEIPMPFRAEVKVRYRSALHQALVIPNGENMAEVVFDLPVRDITPGQRAVFYQGNQVIGGGNILAGFD